MTTRLVALLAIALTGSSVACKGLSDPKTLPVLLTIEGRLTDASSEGAGAEGEVRVALLWIGAQFMTSAAYDGEAYNVASDVAVHPGFPADFTLEVVEPPPDAAMRRLDETALKLLEAVSDTTLDPDARIAFGGIVAYEDVNGNGALDLVGAGAEPVDRVMAATDSVAVIYFEHGTVTIPNVLGFSQEGEFSLGYNLTEVPSCMLEAGGNICPGVVKVLPVDTRIELPLDADPALSNLMCQSYTSDFAHNQVSAGDVPAPSLGLWGDGAQCSEDGATLYQHLGCVEMTGLCNVGQVCSDMVWEFPDDEAGRIAWPCARGDSCELAKTWVSLEEPCPDGMEVEDENEWGKICAISNCKWEPWCHPESLANPCFLDNAETLVADVAFWTVAGDTLVWTEQTHGAEVCETDSEGNENCYEPVLTTTVQRRTLPDGATEGLGSFDGDVWLAGATETELFWYVHPDGPDGGNPEDCPPEDPACFEMPAPQLCRAASASDAPTCTDAPDHRHEMALRHHLILTLTRTDGGGEPGEPWDPRFMEPSGESGLPPTADLMATPFDGGAPQVLASGILPVMGQLVVQDGEGYVYWLEMATMSVQRVPLVGGDVETLAPVPMPAEVMDALEADETGSLGAQVDLRLVGIDQGLALVSLYVAVFPVAGGETLLHAGGFYRLDLQSGEVSEAPTVGARQNHQVAAALLPAGWVVSAGGPVGAPTVLYFVPWDGADPAYVLHVAEAGDAFPARVAGGHLLFDADNALVSVPLP